jgi:uncharacterized RmlC-like cupin family protein
MTPILISELVKTDRDALLESLKTLIHDQPETTGGDSRTVFSMEIESDHRLESGIMFYIRTFVAVKRENPSTLHARSTIVEVKRYRDLTECLAFQVTRDVEKHRN